MNEITRDRTPAPGLALGIVVGWIALELLLRRGVVSALAPSFASGFAVDWTILLVGFPGMAVVLSVLALRAGHDRGLWGYDWSLRAVAVGLLGIIAAVVLSVVTSQIDAALFGLEETGAAFGGVVGDVLRTTPLLAVVFLLGNGVAVPIAEELVWRGIVQTELVAKWGAVVGILLTAVLFALKHVVVDLSLARITTLVVLGLVLGILRRRYGTVSSTVTHIGVNLLSTVSVVLVALV